jgi:hypothetical protein
VFIPVMQESYGFTKLQRAKLWRLVDKLRWACQQAPADERGNYRCALFWVAFCSQLWYFDHHRR